MGVIAARLVFLAFIGLIGYITYNALYLQEQRHAALPTPGQPDGAVRKVMSPGQMPPVTTSVPQPSNFDPPSQLTLAIQRELAARGYGPGPADGLLRYETRNAITAFQKENGLPVTGTPSDELLRYILLGEPATPRASTGSVKASASPGTPAQKAAARPKDDRTVRELQQILADLGYAPGPIDGTMGSETERAIVKFQRDRSIAQTGRITPELLREIKRVTGRAL